MIDLPKIAAAAALSALLATAGCATAPRETPETNARNQARLAAVSLLPACAAAEAVTGELTLKIPDCRLVVRPHKLLLSLHSDPVEQQMFGLSGFLVVSVIDRKGHSLGEFSEITNGQYAYPRVLDVDRDGLQDLIIPRGTDTEDVLYSLWLQLVSGDFTHAGQIRGSEVSWGAGGYITSLREIGPADWEKEFFRIEAGKLQEVALVRGRGFGLPDRRDGCEIERIADGERPERFCASH